ncbi:probable ubiquitin carboxyl-terminal hydrolase FAF-X isoform X1 [Lates japonicus]|uniref:Probable ubiquitin carboxyl-terminal hydrolase FAF-X isoform X1 n=1 Tax=Lates japonicus TaxID=270547 RepID=A0AAD3N3P3_LATJO|nr:probable ubiquitin carboxyl-terminal hydrolase FAF-X isoform X1 [Lates japonicus]
MKLKERTGETGVEETITEGTLGLPKLLPSRHQRKYYATGCERRANLIKRQRRSSWWRWLSGCVRQPQEQIVDTLTGMYYLGCEALGRVNASVGPRPNKGFMGLKSAGACYMNSHSAAGAILLSAASMQPPRHRH